MKPNRLPSAAYLRASFSYCPDTGILRWKERSDVSKWVNTRFAGTVVGTPNGNGFSVRLNNRNHAIHRIIYAIVMGDVLTVEDEIDHKDGNHYNNRWTNLRKATHAQNMCNRDVQCNSQTRIKGVTLTPNSKYLATINSLHLGRFDSAVEAMEAYNKASELIHGEYGRLSSQP